jgi:ATPase subunit of ABC transporter with duplicated ATPase domains
LVRARGQASHEVKQLHREQDLRREQTAKGEGQRSKRGLARGDRDARAKVDAARCTDSGSGQRLRQLEGRMHQALEREAGLQLTRAFTLGLALEGQRSPRDLLLALPPGDLALGGPRRLRVPALVLRPEDRIGLEGPNGTGKSTLIRSMVAERVRTGVRVSHDARFLDRLATRRWIIEPNGDGHWTLREAG